MIVESISHSLLVTEIGPRLDSSAFGFATTLELQPLEEIVSQPRAERAFEIGVGIRQTGYNVFVSGISGTGRAEMSRRVLNHRAATEPVPRDWIYVNNFENSEEPQAIALPAGRGAQLHHEMTNLIGRLLEELPKAFQREDFSHERRICVRPISKREPKSLPNYRNSPRNATSPSNRCRKGRSCSFH